MVWCRCGSQTLQSPRPFGIRWPLWRWWICVNRREAGFGLAGIGNGEHPSWCIDVNRHVLPSGFFIAEVLSTSLEEGAPAPEVFNLACRAVDWLESAADIPWIHVKFMAEFVEALGLMPEEPPVNGSNRSLFDIATGEYVPEELAPKTAMDAATVKGMREIVGMEFGDVHRLDWPRDRRKALVLGAHRFVQAQLGKSRELKSYDVLEALFA